MKNGHSGRGFMFVRNPFVPKDGVLWSNTYEMFEHKGFFSTGGGSMGMITEKFSTKTEFYLFLILEISYLFAFASLVCPLLSFLFIINFSAMILTFLILFIITAFSSQVKLERSELVMFLLFRVSLILFLFYFFIEFRK